jgi:hypothetical protein
LPSDTTLGRLVPVLSVSYPSKVSTKLAHDLLLSR